MSTADWDTEVGPIHNIAATPARAEVHGDGIPHIVAAPRTELAATVVVGGAFIIFAVLVITGWPNRSFVGTLTNVAFPAASLIYVPLAALAARSTRGQLRAAWIALTVGFVMWGIGEALWSYYKHVLGEAPFPSWADVAYLAYVPCVGVALLLFPSDRRWRDQSRLIVDGLIVTGSFFLISWLTVMRPVWQARSGNRLEFALTLAYPAGDVLIMTLGFFVLLRAPSGLRLVLSLLVAGLAFSALGNGAWAYIGDPEGYEIGGMADIFYGADIALVILALIVAQRARPGEATTETPPGRLSLWLPLLPVAIAAGFVVTAPHQTVIEAPVVITGALLIVATLVRQLMQGADLVGREQRIRLLADHLNGELDSAAGYVASILPGDLDGPVAVRSRYLPSRAVGGDSFGYTWLDEDHLIVYLIDVSGHGVRPALLSVSIHNLLRSHSLTTAILLSPDRILAELNSRFSMKNQDGHYFTMWYGVYEQSTGILRYASAGHPPPLILTDQDEGVTSLPPGSGMPLGMLANSDFQTECHFIPPGSQILLYSDGVLGNPPRLEQLIARCAPVASGSSDWLDALAQDLPVAPDGQYEDDCSLVHLRFSGKRWVPPVGLEPTLGGF